MNYERSPRSGGERLLFCDQCCGREIAKQADQKLGEPPQTLCQPFGVLLRATHLFDMLGQKIKC